MQTGSNWYKQIKNYKKNYSNWYKHVQTGSKYFKSIQNSKNGSLEIIQFRLVQAWLQILVLNDIIWFKRVQKRSSLFRLAYNVSN